MTIHPASYFLTGFSLFLIGIMPAQAFTGKNKIPKLSTEVGISKEEFESKTDLMKVTPSNDKSLSYRIRLPKGWTELGSDLIEAQTGTGILRQVSIYVSPPRIERRSMFRVSAIELNSLITVDDWFISYMLEMGFAIEGMKIKSPNLVYAQYTVFEGGEPYGVRAVITRSGSKMIVAEYLVHQEMYMAERDEQIWAMTGFVVENPDLGLAISLKTFNFVDIAKFDYPTNWIVQAPEITDITRMEASILRGRNTEDSKQVNNNELLGRIDISLIAKDQGLTLADEINFLKEGLKKRKYTLGKFIENVPVDGINPLISSVRVDAYEAEGTAKKLAGYEYWVGVLQSKSRYYLVRLTTVSRGENFRVWAENVETYKTLLRSLGPASVATDDGGSNR